MGNFKIRSDNCFSASYFDRSDDRRIAFSGISVVAHRGNCGIRHYKSISEDKGDCITILPVYSCDGIIKYELQIFSEENSDGNITG